MSEPWMNRVLLTQGLTEWEISWEGGSGGCVHHETKRISLGREASRTMFLHEVAHVLEPHEGDGDTHGKFWASRFTDLVEQFLEASLVEENKRLISYAEVRCDGTFMQGVRHLQKEQRWMTKDGHAFETEEERCERLDGPDMAPPAD